MKDLINLMTFKQWCELNGRLYTGARTFEEFERNARDYEAYRSNTKC
jgi:hypothetical protein